MVISNTQLYLSIYCSSINSSCDLGSIQMFMVDEGIKIQYAYKKKII